MSFVPSAAHPTISSSINPHNNTRPNDAQRNNSRPPNRTPNKTPFGSIKLGGLKPKGEGRILKGAGKIALPGFQPVQPRAANPPRGIPNLMSPAQPSSSSVPHNRGDGPRPSTQPAYAHQMLQPNSTLPNYSHPASSNPMFPSQFPSNNLGGAAPYTEPSFGQMEASPMSGKGNPKHGSNKIEYGGAAGGTSPDKATHQHLRELQQAQLLGEDPQYYEERRPTDPFFYPTTVSPLTSIGIQAIEKSVPRGTTESPVRQSNQSTEDGPCFVSAPLQNFVEGELMEIMQQQNDNLSKQLQALEHAKTLAAAQSYQNAHQISQRNEQLRREAEIAIARARDSHEESGALKLLTEIVFDFPPVTADGPISQKASPNTQDWPSLVPPGAVPREEEFQQHQQLGGGGVNNPDPQMVQSPHSSPSLQGPQLVPHPLPSTRQSQESEHYSASLQSYDEQVSVPKFENLESHRQQHDFSPIPPITANDIELQASQYIQSHQSLPEIESQQGMDPRHWIGSEEGEPYMEEDLETVERENAMETIALSAKTILSSRKDLAELNKISKPQPVVKHVCEAALLIVGLLGDGVKDKNSLTWVQVRKALLDKTFFEKLKAFKLKQVTHAQFQRLRRYLLQNGYDEEQIKTHCMPIVPLSTWTRAVGSALSLTEFPGGPEIKPVAHAMGPTTPGGPPTLLVQPDLSKLTPEELRNVKELTVSRPDVAAITFHGYTDCTDLYIPSIVQLEVGVVLVYPQADVSGHKPPPGHGLNKRATVSMFQCWPPSEQDIALDDKGREKYRKKIKQMTEKKNAKFIDYCCETGIWQFQVEHF